MSCPDGKTGVGLLSLKWNNYKSIFFETINTLREKSKYTDATLAVDGHFYHVHKLVMSTCSEYFCDIFETTPCKAPVIVLKDVSRDEIEGLLSYMYLGEVNVHQNNLASFLKVAESLRIKGLAVLDDEPTNLSKSQNSSCNDVSQDSPSLKRQRLENTAVPSVKSLKKSDTPLAIKVEMNSPEIYKTKQNKPPMVKIEMSEVEEQERRIRTKINYEEDPGSDQDTGGVYGPNNFTPEHEASEYESSDHEAPEQDAEHDASTSLFGSTLQQSVSGDVGKSDDGNGDNAAIIEQLDAHLRESPPLSGVNYDVFRKFTSDMMKVINRGNRFIGYGDPKKKLNWWPSTIPWAKGVVHNSEYSDLLLIVRTAYQHYGICQTIAL